VHGHLSRSYHPSLAGLPEAVYTSCRKLNTKTNTRELASRFMPTQSLVIGGSGNLYFTPAGANRPTDRYLQVRPQHDEYLKQETWVRTCSRVRKTFAWDAGLPNGNHPADVPRVLKSYSQDMATVPQLPSRLAVRSYVVSGTVYHRRCVTTTSDSSFQWLTPCERLGC
jgi:hypothetical protein